MDGVADISFTGDTSDAASGDFSVMDHVLLCGSCANSGNIGTYMDDVIIWDDEGNDFTGRLTDRHRIRTILPDANGSVNDFTPLSGTNVENVDDVIRDKDTSYTSATAVGEDMFRFNSIRFATPRRSMASMPRPWCAARVCSPTQVGSRRRGAV